MKKLVFAFLMLFPLSAVFAQTAPQHANLSQQVALQGYDPVSYFKGTAPVKGDKNRSVTHQGAIYYFATDANKMAFQQQPSAYEPQYGGWCAYAMGVDGTKYAVNPETYKIIDNKLYLFYNANFHNTLKSWNKDEAALKAKADQYWQELISKK
jgi:YHS domain-containing protein